jgi:hypothetical protein
MKMNVGLLLIVTNVLTALIVAGGVYFYANQDEVEGVALREYSDSEMALTFSYPEAWGELERANGLGPTYLQINGKTFLASDTAPYKGPDRGMGWTDAMYGIESQQDIEDFCGQPGRMVVDMLSCEVLVNDQGIEYVKIFGEMGSEGGPLDDAFYYFFYNDQAGRYSSIVFSSVSIDDDAIDLEEQLDLMAESVSYGS